MSLRVPTGLLLLSSCADARSVSECGRVWWFDGGWSDIYAGGGTGVEVYAGGPSSSPFYVSFLVTPSSSVVVVMMIISPQCKVVHRWTCSRRVMCSYIPRSSAQAKRTEEEEYGYFDDGGCNCCCYGDGMVVFVGLVGGWLTSGYCVVYGSHFELMLFDYPGIGTTSTHRIMPSVGTVPT